MNRFIFVKVGWADGYRDPDVDPPRGDHSWLWAHQGHESFNFKPHEGRVFGYFPLRSDTGGPDLKRIDPSSTGDRLEGITVVWTATDPSTYRAEAVGWYRNATVFGGEQDDGPWKHPKFVSPDYPDGRCEYICSAREDDAFCIPPPDRNAWKIPSGRYGGVPQANILYPTTEDLSDRDLAWALAILNRIESVSTGVPSERRRREEMWERIIQRGDANSVSPAVAREIGVYGGASGVWVDSDRTDELSTNGYGVSVGLLHTGKSYPDDLTEEAMLYHYPTTDRPAGRDVAEIEATKNAAKLGLTVFGILPGKAADTHAIRRGWVKSWNDETRTFLVIFNQDVRPLPQDSTDLDSTPFEALTSPRDRPRRLASQRPDQPEFKFNVLRRYGPSCAVCDLSIQNVLDAAHIVPDKDHGSSDPRNGLVLCATHHRAYDAGLFDIEPTTLRIHSQKDGPDLASLRISRLDLRHLRKQPGDSALEWRWQRR